MYISRSQYALTAKVSHEKPLMYSNAPAASLGLPGGVQVAYTAIR
jgi:hypothetical protein